MKLVFVYARPAGASLKSFKSHYAQFPICTVPDNSYPYISPNLPGSEH